MRPPREGYRVSEQRTRLYECQHEAPKELVPGFNRLGVFNVRFAACAECRSAEGESHINDFVVKYDEIEVEGSVLYHGQQLVYIERGIE